MASVGSATWRRARVDPHALVAAGRTDPGIQREVNEDRFLADPARGVFAVIDGVGGQAAGGRAADVALATIREHLDRDTRGGRDAITNAIALANNEIHRLAATRAEWDGMACVLTIAIVQDGRVRFGHVGDTRLYRIRGHRIEKITRDHSPVGEREDAGELSESQAMRHPRRNEVYRDVGSELHQADDANFIDSDEIPFEPDAALLLCTDGLTDMVDSTTIARIVAERAGNPEAVVVALIDAAKAAGGKDNVTVVYVEGELFASQLPIASRTARAYGRAVEPDSPAERTRPMKGRHTPAIVAAVIAALFGAVGGIELARTGYRIPWFAATPVTSTPAPRVPDVLVVQPTGSIADAMKDATPGTQILVEPGEYREQIVLKDGVRLVSRVPRAATIRLPATAPDSDAVPAIVATGLASADLVGFRIVGDSATPLAVGIRVENSAVSIVDVEVAGATRAAIEFSGAADASVVASDLRDNPGAALIVHEAAAPRIAHNVFARNGASERASGPLVVMKGAAPRFSGNVFLGVTADSLLAVDPAARLALKNENWFVPVSQRRATSGPASNGPQRIK